MSNHLFFLTLTKIKKTRPLNVWGVLVIDFVLKSEIHLTEIIILASLYFGFATYKKRKLVKYNLLELLQYANNFIKPLKVTTLLNDPRFDFY